MPDPLMTDPMEIVGVMRTHLTEMYEALSWARGYFMSLDLADGYRQGREGRTQPSRSTAKMERALRHAEGYLMNEEASDVRGG